AKSANAAALSGLAQADAKVDGFVRVQLAVNAVNGQLLLGYYGLYASTNGDILSKPIGDVAKSPDDVVTALAYGGMNANNTPAPDVIYAARGRVISVRTGKGSSFNNTFAIPADVTITSIVLDPKNWKTGYAAGSGTAGEAFVYATVDG